MYRPPTVEPALDPDEDKFPDRKLPLKPRRSTGRPPRVAFVEDVPDHDPTEDNLRAAGVRLESYRPYWPSEHPTIPPPLYQLPQVYRLPPPVQPQTPPTRHGGVRRPTLKNRFGASNVSRYTPFEYGGHVANEERANSSAFPLSPGRPKPSGAGPRALPLDRTWEGISARLARRLSPRPYDTRYTAFPPADSEDPVAEPPEPHNHQRPRPRTDATSNSASSDANWDDSHAITHPVEADDGRGLCFEVPTDRNPQKLVLYTDILDLGTDEAEGNAWSEVKSYPDEHATCDLVSAKTLEQGSDEMGGPRTFIGRENGTPSMKPSAEPRIVWLHVRRPTLSLEFLELLVQQCPYISLDLMRVALESLKRLRTTFTTTSDGQMHYELGFSMRHVGKFHKFDTDASSYTSPVIFASCPALTLEASGTSLAGGQGMDSITAQGLLGSLYGYDVDREREKEQIVQKVLEKGVENRVFHVRQTWLMLIGHQVLITMSDRGLNEMLSDSIVLGNGSSKLGKLEDYIIVRLLDHRKKAYNISLGRSSEYTEFFQQAVLLATGTPDAADDFKLLKESGDPFTESDWKGLLTSSCAEHLTVQLAHMATELEQPGPRLALPAPEPEPPNVNLPGHRHDSDSHQQESVAWNWVSCDVGTKNLLGRRRPESGHESVTKTTDRDLASLSHRQFEGGHNSSKFPSEVQTHDAGEKGPVVDAQNAYKPKTEEQPVAQQPNMAVESDQQLRSESDEVIIEDKPLPMSPPEMDSHSPNPLSPWQYLVYQPDPKSPPPLEHIKIWDGMAIPMSSNSNGGSSLDVHLDNLSEVSVSSCGSGSSSSDSLDADPYENYARGLESPYEISSGFQESYHRYESAAGSKRFSGSAEESHLRQGRQGRFTLKGSPGARVRFTPPEYVQDSPGPGCETHEGPESGTNRSNGPQETVVLPPFFHWRPRNQSCEQATTDAMGGSLKLLDQIQSDIKSNLKGNLYDRAYLCSKSEFIFRQKFHLQQMSSLPTTESAAVTSPQGGETSSGDITRSKVKEEEPGAAATATDSSPARDGVGAQRPALSPLPSSADPAPASATSTYDAMILRQLLQVSSKVLSAFVPKSESSNAHGISKLYWGAMDYIFRQMLWRRYSQQCGNHTFKSHFGGQEGPNTGSLARNESCAGRSEGPSGQPCFQDEASALAHLHQVHGSCTVTTEHPHDDPCLAWLHQVIDETRGACRCQGSINEPLGLAEDFVMQIVHILKAILDLQSAATGVSRSHTPQQEGFTPFLHSSVTKAFQNIVEMCMLRSHLLSLKNRIQHSSLAASSGKPSKAGDENTNRRKVSALVRWEKGAYDNARKHIYNARHEMILEGDSARRITSAQMQPVGIEFLATVLMGNVQKALPVLPGPQVHGEINANQPHFIDVYRQYVSQLSFRCYNRPSRRVFLDIYAFEEELAALGRLLEAQGKLLDDVLYLTSPESFRKSDEDREKTFARQKMEAQHQRAHIDQQSKEVQILQHKSTALKEQVKQAIEVLEEDHGKAIRVFTIVTLFFLPLSFVSTFLGMNTTDVDGLKWDQSIFWATSLPITAFVLLTAMVYGYKGDEISEWLSTKMRSVRPGTNDAEVQRQGNLKRRLPHSRPFGGIDKRETMDSLGNIG